MSGIFTNYTTFLKQPTLSGTLALAITTTLGFLFSMIVRDNFGYPDWFLISLFAILMAFYWIHNHLVSIHSVVDKAVNYSNDFNPVSG
jgi:hypothetical protein